MNGKKECTTTGASVFYKANMYNITLLVVNYLESMVLEYSAKPFVGQIIVKTFFENIFINIRNIEIMG